MLRLLIFWGIICLVQAFFIELDPDEAYYWIYTKQLDWGYFDHPPGIALIIKSGFVLFPNELGVRLGVILLHLLSIYIFWLWIGQPKERKQIWFMLALLLAMPLLQVYGLIATPDGPLLFFAVLFFYWYQRFLEEPTYLNTFLLGFCMAALLYSKYHGVLLIFFVVISNWSLLKNPRFYMASIFGALLFVPHLYWQYLNDFPSFRYHLQGRNDSYELKYTTTYLLNQLLIFSPFLLPFWLKALRESWSKDRMVRACYFVLFGFWGFFFYSSFKGHVEPQWTSILSIPIAYLLYHYSSTKPAFRKWLYRMALFSFGIILFFRFFALMSNPFGFKSNFHRSDWIYELKKEANGKPIVFENSYRDAAKYTFYAKEIALTFADHYYRKNQFDIWKKEVPLHNGVLLMVTQEHKDFSCNFCKKIKVDRKTFLLQEWELVQINQKVKVQPELVKYQVNPNSDLALKLNIHNPYAHAIHSFKGNAPLQLMAAVYQDENYQGYELSLELEQLDFFIPPNDSIQVKASIPIPELPEGSYQFYIGFAMRNIHPAVQSPAIQVNITNAKE